MPTPEPNKAHDEAIAKLKENGGLVAAHSLGSGKTLLSLRAAKELGGKSLFVTPASLVSNVEKEQAKHGIKTDSDIMSYEAAANNYRDLLKKNYNLIVFDEGHRLRNVDSERVQKLKTLIDKSPHNLILSATPAFNKPEDLGKLVNLVSKKPTFPGDEKRFQQEFTREKVVRPKLLDRILHGARTYKVEETFVPEKYKEPLGKFVHRYDALQSKLQEFPSITENEVHVPMSRRQQKVYEYYEGNLPIALKWKIKLGLPPDKRDASKLNFFSNSLRQISNSTDNFSRNPLGEPTTPKIEIASSKLADMRSKDPNFRGLVYSNFLASGTQPYSKELKKKGISHNILTGDLSKLERKRMVDEYNTGKTPVLMISSAGAEGLDLKGTKLVQVLEPHFNRSKIDQVVGRARRFRSHAHLPENERHVEVEHYMSVKPKGWTGKERGGTIDSYLYSMSKEKDKQIKELLDAVPLSHVEDKKNEPRKPDTKV